MKVTGSRGSIEALFTGRSARWARHEGGSVHWSLTRWDTQALERCVLRFVRFSAVGCGAPVTVWDSSRSLGIHPNPTPSPGPLWCSVPPHRPNFHSIHGTGTIAWSCSWAHTCTLHIRICLPKSVHSMPYRRPLLACFQIRLVQCPSSCSLAPSPPRSLSSRTCIHWCGSSVQPVKSLRVTH